MKRCSPRLQFHDDDDGSELVERPSWDSISPQQPSFSFIITFFFSIPSWHRYFLIQGWFFLALPLSRRSILFYQRSVIIHIVSMCNICFVCHGRNGEQSRLHAIYGALPLSCSFVKIFKHQKLYRNVRTHTRSTPHTGLIPAYESNICVASCAHTKNCSISCSNTM